MYSDWLGAQYIDQTDLELREILLSLLSAKIKGVFLTRDSF